MPETSIAEAALPLFHAACSVGAEWQPIGDYDKATAPPVLLRGEGQMVLGQWGLLDPHPGSDASLVRAWRSMEDSTLDSELWFEPDEFAALSNNDEQFFLQR